MTTVERNAFHSEEVHDAQKLYTSAYQRLNDLSNETCRIMVDSISEMPLEEMKLVYNMRKILAYGGMLEVDGHTPLMPEDEQRIANALSNRLSDIFRNEDGSRIITFAPKKISLSHGNKMSLKLNVPTLYASDNLTEELMDFVYQVAKVHHTITGKYPHVELQINGGTCRVQKWDHRIAKPSFI